MLAIAAPSVDVSALPGVESATMSVELPGGGSGWTNDISVEGHPAPKRGELINVDWAIVSRDYFRTMRIPILRGRTFTADEDVGGKPVVLVDENLARKFWPNEDAIGKHIGYDSPTPHEVIGIVKEVGIYGSNAKPLIKIYTPLGRAWLRGILAPIITKRDSARVWPPIWSAKSAPGWMNRSATRLWCRLICSPVSPASM